MISRRSVRNILKGLVAAALCCATPYVSPQELIANRDAGVESLTRNEARLYFTMRLKNWPNGTLVKVFVLPDNNPLHIRFSNEVLGLYPYQLRRVWDRQIFSGTGQAPTTVSSEQEMLERVAKTPGAIGYADGPIDHSNIRLLEVR